MWVCVCVCDQQQQQTDGAWYRLHTAVVRPSPPSIPSSMVPDCGIVLYVMGLLLFHLTRFQLTFSGEHGVVHGMYRIVHRAHRQCSEQQRMGMAHSAPAPDTTTMKATVDKYNTQRCSGKRAMTSHSAVSVLLRSPEASTSHKNTSCRTCCWNLGATERPT